MKKPSPIVVNKRLLEQLGRGVVSNWRANAEGSLTIHSTRATQLDKIKQLVRLGSWSLSPAQKVCKGVIHRVHPSITEEELMEEASAYYQDDKIKIKVERVKKRREGELRVTATVINTFEAEKEKRPEIVVILNQNYQVQQHVPEPIMCFNCQRFGHKADACKGKQRCAKCGGPHRAENCDSGIKKCPNCPGSHSSSRCPAWKNSQTVIKVAVSENISWAAAAAKVQSGKVQQQQMELKQIANEAAELVSTSIDSEYEADDWEAEAENVARPTTPSTRKKKKKKKKKRSGSNPGPFNGTVTINSGHSDGIFPSAFANGLDPSAFAFANGINPPVIANGKNPSATANGRNQTNVLPSMPSLTET